MCGNFSFRKRQQEAAVLRHFNCEKPEFQLPLKFKQAPKSEVAVIRQVSDKREMSMMQWWLVPFWNATPETTYTTFNAACEGIEKKPAYRMPIRRQRCLIPADGFYEWIGDGKQKQAYYIHRRDDEPFAFAGLWDTWSKSAPPFESCSMMTTAPADWFKPYHHRQALILSPNDYEIWLDPTMNDPKKLEYIYEPMGDDILEVYPVRPHKKDITGPECIERMQEA